MTLPDTASGNSAQPGRIARLRLAVIDRLAPGEMPVMLLWAALAGLAGALATVAFREAINLLLWLFTGERSGLVEAARSLGPVRRMLTPAAGGLVAGLLLWWGQRRGIAASGSDYMEAVAVGDGKIPTGATLLRSGSSLLTIASGGSIGREGPMVQLAALLGSVCARINAFSPQRRRLLVACGAAAGITSAYNAPVAGSLFVAEIVLGSIAMESFGPLLVASVVANLTIHQFFGYEPLYAIPAFPQMTGLDGVFYVLLGIVCGIVAPLFLALLEHSRRWFARTGLSLPLRLALGGLLAGAISIVTPEAWGNGYSTVNAILAGHWLGLALITLLVLKLAATASTVGSGAVGGIFTPTLFVGAVIGALFGQGLHLLWPGIVTNNHSSTAVAMGAFLAATTHAPLMSILMIFEMTGTYPVVLPLMLACVPAYVAARAIRVESIYSPSLKRQESHFPRPEFSAQRLSSLFRPDPPTLNARDDVPTIAAQFATHRFQYLYVIDDNQHYLGVVSLHDLRVLLADPARQAGVTAASILVAGFQQLSPDMPLEEALAEFTRHRGERLPVVGADGRLVGAAWKTDLMLALHESLGRVR